MQILNFDGETYEAKHDHKRLSSQLEMVKRLTLFYDDPPQWWTLTEISLYADAPESSISARLRDLRKPKFGGYKVERRRRGDPKQGVWEYRVSKG